MVVPALSPSMPPQRTQSPRAAMVWRPRWGAANLQRNTHLQSFQGRQQMPGCCQLPRRRCYNNTARLIDDERKAWLQGKALRSGRARTQCSTDNVRLVSIGHLASTMLLQTKATFAPFPPAVQNMYAGHCASPCVFAPCLEERNVQCCSG